MHKRREETGRRVTPSPRGSRRLPRTRCLAGRKTILRGVILLGPRGGAGLRCSRADVRPQPSDPERGPSLAGGPLGGRARFPGDAFSAAPRAARTSLADAPSGGPGAEPWARRRPGGGLGVAVLDPARAWSPSGRPRRTSPGLRWVSRGVWPWRSRLPSAAAARLLLDADQRVGCPDPLCLGVLGTTWARRWFLCVLSQLPNAQLGTSVIQVTPLNSCTVK